MRRARPPRCAGLVCQDSICRRSNQGRPTLYGAQLVQGWAPTAWVACERHSLVDRGLSAGYTRPCCLFLRLIQFGWGATRPRATALPAATGQAVTGSLVAQEQRPFTLGTEPTIPKQGERTVPKGGWNCCGLEKSEFQRRPIKHFRLIRSRVPHRCLQLGME